MPHSTNSSTNVHDVTGVPVNISIKGPRMDSSSADSTSTSWSRNRANPEVHGDVADYAVLLTRIPTIDDVLDGQVSMLGHDFVAYRNHVYRIVNLCMAIAGGRGQLEKVATAAAFHALGIWTNGTFDYIPPSIALAHEY